ncbi:hypothetical protein HK100_007727, partial [Physocladia obscura]
ESAKLKRKREIKTLVDTEVSHEIHDQVSSISKVCRMSPIFIWVPLIFPGKKLFVEIPECLRDISEHCENVDSDRGHQRSQESMVLDFESESVLKTIPKSIFTPYADWVQNRWGDVPKQSICKYLQEVFSPLLSIPSTTWDT